MPNYENFNEILCLKNCVSRGGCRQSPQDSIGGPKKPGPMKFETKSPYRPLYIAHALLILIILELSYSDCS